MLALQDRSCNIEVQEVVMDLNSYFEGKPRGSKAELARKLGITRTWMGLLISKRRVPSAELAVEIEHQTEGSVTRKDLRPDLWT